MSERVDARRLAGAPISWGVCEVPGWGLQLPPERVLAEMAALGLTATELGPQGWLALDGAQVKRTLDGYGLRLVGGFVPVVVRAPDLERARRAAAQLAQGGGEVFVAALVQDELWSAPVPLDADGWQRAGEDLRTLAAIAGEAGLTLCCIPTSARSRRPPTTSNSRSRTRTSRGVWTPATC